jgi:hypothetical protein
MVALRSAFERDGDDRDRRRQRPKPDPADWLTLQQAACELNVSISTARRMIRKGKLRNRVVPRPGGFAYLVYVPGSRHANGLGGHACSDTSAEESAPRDLTAYREARNGGAPDAKVHELEAQVERLSEALSRALRTKQKALPAGMGQPDVNAADPYARYRWLVRRKRWWPF